MEQQPTTTEEKLIEHISAEITAYTRYLAVFRSRVAFSVLAGPFVLLTSFVVAGHGAATIKFNWWLLGAALVSYIGLGFYGGMLDWHITNQCNKWRRLVVKLSKREVIHESDVTFEHQSVRAYLWGFTLCLCAFLSIAFAFFAN